MDDWLGNAVVVLVRFCQDFSLDNFLISVWASIGIIAIQGLKMIAAAFVTAEIKIWAEKHPLKSQPFRHHFHRHKGWSLRKCDQGLCTEIK